jgi:hypothetical protein
MIADERVWIDRSKDSSGVQVSDLIAIALKSILISHIVIASRHHGCDLGPNREEPNVAIAQS